MLSESFEAELVKETGVGLALPDTVLEG
jgi:hypothetical protein